MKNIRTKFKLTISLLFLLSWMIPFRAPAQSMIVLMNDGVENKTQIGSIQHFSFLEGDLLLKLINGSMESFGVAEIRKIYFDQTINNSDTTDTSDDSDSTDTDSINDTTSSHQYNESKIEVYPNPATTQLYIKSGNETISIVTIYRMDGILVKKIQLSASDFSIAINDLSNGLYVLRINNQTIKFIKQ